LQFAPHPEGYDNNRRDPDDLADDYRGDINAGEISKTAWPPLHPGSRTLPDLRSLKKFEKVE